MPAGVLGSSKRTRRRTGLALAAFASVMPLTGCDVLIPTTYRYRMTVEVETPQGLRTGSSVIEASFRKGIAFPGPEAGGTKLSARGEAVAVDLPGGTLFALLSSEARGADAAATYASAAYNPVTIAGTRGPDNAKRIFRPISEWTQPAVLSRQFYPTFVRFRDVNQPKTVEAVDPDDLASSFGQGTRLKRVVIRRTDEPVTSGITSRLKWLGPHPEPGLDNDFVATTSPTFAQRLRHGDFRKESK